MSRLLSRLRHRDEGASAVEYGLLVALIAVVIAVAVYGLGTALNNKFQTASNCVTQAGGANASACP